MRIGIFGGTFNPPHEGHLYLALSAIRLLKLDRVEMVVCHDPPHRDRPKVDALHRFAMVVLSCAGIDRLVASARELRRPGPSFTVDTLREIAGELPGSELFLLLGADSYDDLPNWHEPEQIVDLAHLVVAPRAGAVGVASLRADDRDRLCQPDQPLPKQSRAVIPLALDEHPASARAIRKQLADRATVADAIDYLPPTVTRYIAEHRLYLAAAAQPAEWDRLGASERGLR